MKERNAIALAALIDPGLSHGVADHGLIRGIGIVNLVQGAGDKQDFYPIGYRFYARDHDGKTKNEHFAKMISNASRDFVGIMAHPMKVDTAKYIPPDRLQTHGD